jgi:type IV pilus assembly protein PilW
MTRPERIRPNMVLKPERSRTPAADDGFTIVELLVALVVALVITGVAYSIFVFQQRHFANQRLVMRAQQNLRGAFLILEQELHMAGYDPEDSGGFGVVDVRRYDVEEYHKCTPDGQPVLFYTYDVDEDGGLDDSNHGRNREHAKFRISDADNDGHVCLTWDNGAGRNPLAENIQAIGFAYAVDTDRDGQCDSWPGGGSLIWAVDSNNDNLLDADIDADGDGDIDEEDDTNGDHRIDAADGHALNPQVALNCIKAVRVWVLAETPGRLQGWANKRTYVVGDRILAPGDDGKMRFVLQTRVHCRNL